MSDATDLSDLYQEIILDHNRQPRNRRVLADADRIAEGDNPLCGDQVRIFIKLDGDQIADCAFDGSGCAISQASASLMTEAVIGGSRGEARDLSKRFRAVVTGTGEAGSSGNPESTAESGPPLGKLEALVGVRQYPMRVKCATLAWHALEEAISGLGDA